MTTAIVGRMTPGSRRISSSDAASTAPVFRPDGAGSLPLPDRAAGDDERAVRLAAHRVGRLLVHADLRRRRHELEAVGTDRLGAEENGPDAVTARLERARDDLARRTIAAEGVDGNPDGGGHRGRVT
jgi:hypothetical protein